MRLSFCIDGKEFSLTGVVVRCRAAQDGYYGYGVRFNQVDDNTANAIVQYLFKRQKEIIDL
jgi:c-di-GMP-binding flagellar brake protein YcgR